MLGTGKHLGTDIVWSLRWLPSGAYLEEIKGRHMGFKWGWDGAQASSCWEQDNTGARARSGRPGRVAAGGIAAGQGAGRP
jgi:hypothetical protein